MAACAATTLAPGAPADGSQTVQTLPRVEIVGTTPLPGPQIPREEIAAPTQATTAAEIEESGATNLGDFLNRRFGSVYVNEIQGNPFQPDVSYRGYTASPLVGTPQKLSLYVDGVRINQPFGDVVSWELIPKAAIETVILVPGSNPLFGLEAGGSNARGLSWFGTADAFRESGWRDDAPSRVDQLFGKLGWTSGATQVNLTARAASSTLYGNGLQDQQLLARRYASVYTIPDITRDNAGLATMVASHRFND
ncbi:MAG: Plug domain-containing protein, partial [Caldimonas sp.]